MAQGILGNAPIDPLYFNELVVSDVDPNPCWSHIQIAPSDGKRRQTEAWATPMGL